MAFYYYIETKNGEVEYEFEPTDSDIQKGLEYIVKNKTPKELVCDMRELCEGENTLEDYYYDELEEYFDTEARQRYAESEQDKADLYYDYWHNKL